MEKHIKYSDLNINLNTENKAFIFNDNAVTVAQYLPLADKYDLISIALQKSYVDGIYNELLLDAYFHLALVYLYTDIEFTDEDKLDEMSLFDKLVTSGFIDEMLKVFNKDEYEELHLILSKTVEMKMKYSISAASLISKIIDDLPRNADAAQKIIDNFDKEKFKEVMNFAIAANGGRDIVLKEVK